MKESNLFCDDGFPLCLPLLFIGIDFRQHLLSTLAHLSYKDILQIMFA